MWKLGPSERLSRWRDFRKRLNTLGLDEALQESVEFWHS